MSVAVWVNQHKSAASKYWRWCTQGASESPTNTTRLPRVSGFRIKRVFSEQFFRIAAPLPAIQPDIAERFRAFPKAFQSRD